MSLKLSLKNMCRVEVRTVNTRHLLASFNGDSEAGLCHCSRTDLGPGQLLVSRAVCCTSRQATLLSVSSQFIYKTNFGRLINLLGHWFLMRCCFSQVSKHYKD